MEKKQLTGVCFLDLSAAFDIVDHPLLLQKLKLYGFAEDSLGWVESYLSGRNQTVYIEGIHSKVLPVPLFYKFFTNELPELVHDHPPSPGKLYNMSCEQCGTLCCYADDSSFSCASTSLDIIETKLTDDYNTITPLQLS